MKEIQLTQGYVALVDDEDFWWLNRWQWHAQRSRGTVYAKRMVTQGVAAWMHREILALSPGGQVDHCDGNGLNNQKYNLRVCSEQDNARNRHVRSDSASGFKGVGWDRVMCKWRARISLGNGKRKVLGYFDTPEQAAVAYDKGARDLFGTFARLNFPDGD